MLYIILDLLLDGDSISGCFCFTFLDVMDTLSEDISLDDPTDSPANLTYASLYGDANSFLESSAVTTP